MKFPLAVAVAGLCVLTAGCGNDGSKVFGEQSEPCPATALSNDPEGQNAKQGTDCFMTEFEAGSPVVWDVVISTY